MKRLLIFVVSLTITGSAWAANFDSQAFQATNHTVEAVFQQRFVKMKSGSKDYTTRYKPSAGALSYAYENGPMTLGLSASYEYGNRKYDFNSRSGRYFDGSGKLRDETAGVTLFGSYRMLDGWYGKGSLFLGYNSTKPKYLRNDLIGDYDTRGSKHSTLFGTSLEVGKSFDLSDGIMFTPHVGFDYAYIPGTAYAYDMGGAYQGDLTGRSQNFYEIPVGVGLSKTFDAGCWQFTPNVDVTMVNTVGHMRSKNFYPGFSSYNGSEWKTYGIAAGHIGGRVSAGLDAKYNDRVDFGVDYSYEGRKRYTDHRIGAKVGVSF